MNILTRPEIGTWVRENIAQAEYVTIAVAYFHPDDTLREILDEVPSLRVIVSEEFHVNDPHPLREISRAASVRSVPTDSEFGRLHAKTVLVKSEDGRRQALIGSANFTSNGLFFNNELCVSLDSQTRPDIPLLDELEDYIQRLYEVAKEPDWERAFDVWNNQMQRRRGRLQSQSATDETPNYWILKTTSGASGPSYWQNFLAEGTVAIGWTDLKLNPSEVSYHRLESAFKGLYSKKGRAQHSAKTVWIFARDWRIGDLVIICRGYRGQEQIPPVHFYGYARVTGEFCLDRRSSWWHFKRVANIQPVDQYLPKEAFVEALDMGSLTRTIHSTNEYHFQRFVEIVQSRLGVPLEV